MFAGFAQTFIPQTTPEMNKHDHRNGEQGGQDNQQNGVDIVAIKGSIPRKNPPNYRMIQVNCQAKVT